MKGSDELLFWKKVPPLVKSIPKDSQSPKTEGTRDRRAKVAPVALRDGIVMRYRERPCIAGQRKMVMDSDECVREKKVMHTLYAISIRRFVGIEESVPCAYA